MIIQAPFRPYYERLVCAVCAPCRRRSGVDLRRLHRQTTQEIAALRHHAGGTTQMGMCFAQVQPVTDGRKVEFCVGWVVRHLTLDPSLIELLFPIKPHLSCGTPLTRPSATLSHPMGEGQLPLPRAMSPGRSGEGNVMRAGRGGAMWLKPQTAGGI